MKNKKSLIAIIALLLVVVVGATIAYYTSSTSFENVFNTGLYKVVVTEEFVSPDNWAPGETIPKTVTSTNEGTVPAAVRISYTEVWEDENENDITSQITPNPAIINFDNTNDWTLSNGYYYYNYILNPEDVTSSFISGVTLDPNLNSVTCTGTGNTRTCEATNQATGATYKLTLTIETVQADKYQEVWGTNVSITEKPPAITYISRQVEGEITPGDIIGIGETEDFYVISSNSTKTVLLAKYNLLVGNVLEEDWNSSVIPTSTAGYGLQNEDVIGYNASTIGWQGTTSFASTRYWLNGNDLKNPYNENDTIYNDISNNRFKYRSDNSIAYPYVYDSNSNIYQYISGQDGYVNKLIEMGAPSTITGRLLSYEEANSSTSITDNGESIIINGTSYWLGSIQYNNIWSVDASHSALDASNSWIDYELYMCIRPVIEIPTSELQ